MLNPGSCCYCIEGYIDRVFSSVDGSKLQKVTEGIGHARRTRVPDEILRACMSWSLEFIKKNYWHRACGTHQKLVVVRTLINRSDVESWKTWSQPIRVKLGMWLLSCIIDVSGWFTKEQFVRTAAHTTTLCQRLEFMAIKDAIVDTAELFSPIAYPMLIEPNDWEHTRPGGYLLNEVMRGHDMVRRGEVSPIQGETLIDFLNKIQKVGYKINSFVMTVAEQLEDKGIAIGKFIPIVDYDLPPKPIDIDTNKEARQSYKRECAEVYNKKADSFKRSCRTRMTMEAAKLFKDRETILHTMVV